MSAWCKERNFSGEHWESCLVELLKNAIGKATLASISLNKETTGKCCTLKCLDVTFDRSPSFKYLAEINIIKCKRCLEALKTMMVTTRNKEQRLLFLIFNHLGFLVIDYALGHLTLSASQLDKLERMQNHGMRILLCCTRHTSIRITRYQWSTDILWHKLRPSYLLPTMTVRL